MPAIDPASLLSSAGCYNCFGPLTTTQLMRLALLRDIVLAGNPNAMTDPQSLMTQANCFSCFSNASMGDLMELALLAQIVQNGSTGGGGGGSGFVSGLFTLSQVQWVVPHGLLAVPSNVQVVLHCTSNDAASGWVTGQEADIFDFSAPGDGIPNFSVTRDATNITVASDNQPVGNEGSIVFSGIVGNNPVSVTSFNNFRLKVYAKL